jgi:nicotinate-nucleotide adenylyltransferase
MKIGILGGTFDPPHLGHLVIAEHVRQELLLGKVVFIPAAIPPHKTAAAITDGFHRVAMLRMAIQLNPYFEVDEMELHRGGVSYTVDTLAELSRKWPDDQLVLLIGEDNFAEFGTWREPERILRLAQVVVMTRPGFDEEVRRKIPNGMLVCQVPEIAISSSTIRSRARDGRSIRYLVPQSVEKYIATHSLYR